MNQFTVADLKRTVDACVGADEVGVFDNSTADTSFAELGLDSLAVYELVTRLQDELKIPISDEVIETMKTPNLLIGFINGRLVEASS
jgi:acyl carrier protein